MNFPRKTLTLAAVLASLTILPASAASSHDRVYSVYEKSRAEGERTWCRGSWSDCVAVSSDTDEVRDRIGKLIEKNFDVTVQPVAKTGMFIVQLGSCERESLVVLCASTHYKHRTYFLRVIRGHSVRGALDEESRRVLASTFLKDRDAQRQFLNYVDETFRRIQNESER